MKKIEKLSKRRKLAIFSVLAMFLSIVYSFHIFACEQYGRPDNSHFNSISPTITTSITFNIHDFLGIQPACNKGKYSDARDRMTPEQIEFHKENAEFYNTF